MGLVRLILDKARCVGTGMCAQIAPAVIAIGPDFKGKVVVDVVELDDQIKEAVENCPVQAISFDADDNV